MKHTTKAGQFLLVGALIGSFALTSQAVTTSVAPAWPSSPLLQTMDPSRANSERDVKLNRDLAQTFQLPSEIILDKVTILVGESQDLNMTFDFVVFQVADVQAGGALSGIELLRIPDVSVAGLSVPTDKT